MIYLKEVSQHLLNFYMLSYNYHMPSIISFLSSSAQWYSYIRHYKNIPYYLEYGGSILLQHTDN
jgi:hypothetical protein